MNEWWKQGSTAVEQRATSTSKNWWESGAKRVGDEPAAPKPTRGLSGLAKDTGIGLAQGAIGLAGAAGDAYGLASGNMDNALSRTTDRWRESLEDKKSDDLKARIRRRSEAIESADSTLGKAGAAIRETLTDPALALDTAATNVATLLPGAAAGRAVGAARAARGFQAARAGGQKLTEEAKKQVLKRAGREATGTAIGVGALQQGVDVAGGAYSDLMAQPDEVWDAMPNFAGALARHNGDRQAAKHELALSVARRSLPVAVGISVASQALPGARALERAIVGASTRGAGQAAGRLAGTRAAVRGIVGEGTQELAEEGGGQLASNIVARSATGDDRGVWDGVGEAAGMGFAGGALLGGIGGVREGLSARREAALLRGDTPSVEQPPIGAPGWTTSPGAGDPDAIEAAPAVDPRLAAANLFDPGTSPGAAQEPQPGMEFRPEFDTGDLGLEDPAEAARARAATVDFEPEPVVPQWDTELGAAPEPQGLDVPLPEFDTGDLAIDERPLSERLGLDPAAGPLSAAAARAVDSGASQMFTDVTFLGATGRELVPQGQRREIRDDSGIVDVDARVVPDRQLTPVAQGAFDSGVLAFQAGMPRSELEAIPNVSQRTIQLRGYDAAARQITNQPGEARGTEARQAQQEGAQRAPEGTTPTLPAPQVERRFLSERGATEFVQQNDLQATHEIARRNRAFVVRPRETGAAELELEANAAATSSVNTLPAPTEAQIKVGNYKKGHVSINGQDISIENPAGSKRRPEWPALKNHYGYIKGSKGADKDHVDVFLTDRAGDASLPVFVVDQTRADGKTFDEHKIVMGAATEEEARRVYLQNYQQGWNGLGAITQMTQDEFKAWARDPKQTTKPVALGQAEPQTTAAQPAASSQAGSPVAVAPVAQAVEPAALAKKPRAAAITNWMSGQYQGKTVYSNGHIIDLSGTEPHVRNWQSRARSGSSGTLREGAVANVVHGVEQMRSPMPLTPVATRPASLDPESRDTRTLVAFQRQADELAIYLDQRYAQYFVSKFKGAEFQAGDEAGGPVAVHHDGELVGVVMPVRNMEGGARTPNEIRGFPSRRQTSPETSAPTAAPEPATAETPTVAAEPAETITFSTSDSGKSIYVHGDPEAIRAQLKAAGFKGVGIRREDRLQFPSRLETRLREILGAGNSKRVTGASDETPVSRNYAARGRGREELWSRAPVPAEDAGSSTSFADAAADDSGQRAALDASQSDSTVARSADAGQEDAPAVDPDQTPGNTVARQVAQEVKQAPADEPAPVSEAFDKLFETIESREGDDGNVVLFSSKAGGDATEDAEVRQVMAQYTGHPNAPSEAEVRAALEDYRTTEQAYGGRQAWEAAREAKRTKLAYPRWVQVRTQHFKRWFGDWEMARLERDMRRVRGSRQLDAVRQEIVGKEMVNAASGFAATVSVSSLRKMASQSNVVRSISSQAHMQALGNIDTLFRLAVLRETRAPKKARDAGDLSAVHHFDVPMPFDGDVLHVKIMAKEFVDEGKGNRLYLIEAVEIENAGVVGEDPGVSGQFQRSDAASSPPAGVSNTFAQKLAAVNGDAASKVIDLETGEPLAVYHGTVAEFSAFDNSKTGANDRGLWGRGHYFSAVVENANSYALRQGDGAQVIPAFVSIKSPLVLRTGEDLVTRLPDGRNFRELVGPQLNGSRIKALAEAGGHDGVIQIKPDGLIGDLVAYDAHQIKSATGNTGNFDGGNPDIRFSQKFQQAGLTSVVIPERFGQQTEPSASWPKRILPAGDGRMSPRSGARAHVLFGLTLPPLSASSPSWRPSGRTGKTRQT